ncbi:Uma2 family endonuclease [Actinoplanes sp. KI2]|uniref:Uma2 family endonuclease n=1 Tax=Actinoplanes sp. KI2 TaxID=2983315 RepID=UPI002950071D|nr:Uma2 family endonuclease [Actinoplanes sp. KI2]
MRLVSVREPATRSQGRHHDRGHSHRRPADHRRGLPRPRRDSRSHRAVRWKPAHVTPLHHHSSTRPRRAGRRPPHPGAGRRLPRAAGTEPPAEPDRIPSPDLVITTDMEHKLVLDADSVLLVCEITSPSNAATDKVLKMHYYAAAGIPWYLLVEQDSATLHLYALVDDTYVEKAVVRPGDLLRLTEPVVAVLDPVELSPPL